MSQDILAIFNTAITTARAADAARDQLAKVMHQTMRELLPPDSGINLLAKPVPEYLLGARVISGKSHGASTYRIISVLKVIADAINPELSTWVCDAVPVSKISGKELAPVRLQGNMGYVSFIDDEKDSYASSRVIALVAKTLNPAPADA